MAKKQKVGKTPKLGRSYRDKQKGRYEKQRLRTEANRLRRLERRIKQHPNDLQTKALLPPK